MLNNAEMQKESSSQTDAAAVAYCDILRKWALQKVARELLWTLKLLEVSDTGLVFQELFSFQC